MFCRLSTCQSAVNFKERLSILIRLFNAANRLTVWSSRYCFLCSLSELSATSLPGAQDVRILWYTICVP
jgi:hypothetical protein